MRESSAGGVVCHMGSITAALGERVRPAPRNPTTALVGSGGQSQEVWEKLHLKRKISVSQPAS